MADDAAMTVYEFARAVEVVHRVPVLVVGGGPSGLAAAIAATPDSQSLSYEIDSEGFKVVADRLVEEAGVHPLLHRAFAAPVMNGDTVAGVIVESKAGRGASGGTARHWPQQPRMSPRHHRSSARAAIRDT